MRNSFQPYVPRGIKNSDAHEPTPEKTLQAVITLFPAFWSLFFNYKNERKVTDRTAYDYSKEVLASVRDMLPGTDMKPEKLDEFRRIYADFVNSSATELILKGNAHLLPEKAKSTARSELHAIFVRWYIKYKSQRDAERSSKNPRKKVPSDRPDITIRTNPEIEWLERVWVIEYFDTWEVVSRTKSKMDRIFSPKKQKKEERKEEEFVLT